MALWQRAEWAADEPKAIKWHEAHKNHVCWCGGGGEMEVIWTHNTPNGLALKCVKYEIKVVRLAVQAPGK